MSDRAASPLSEVRAAEREAATRIDQARARADERVRLARTDARDLVERARDEGVREADRRHAVALEQAESEARDIIAAEHERAEALRAGCDAYLDALVDEMCALVLPPDQGAEEG
ncbi:MAG: hypothetical protein ACYTGN_12865 [Planctomycetota bacterium]|jgi:vacuolar-type H+-ATPase subunit H